MHKLPNLLFCDIAVAVVILLSSLYLSLDMVARDKERVDLLIRKRSRPLESRDLIDLICLISNLEVLNGYCLNPSVVLVSRNGQQHSKLRY